MAWPSETPAPANTVLVVDSPEWLAKRDELLKAHVAAKDTLDRAKESEMSIRKELTAFLFPTPKEGVNRVPLANGWNMKLQNTVTMSIKASNETVEAAEDAAGEIGNEGTFLFERIITWKPEFSKSEYKKLDTSFETHKKVKLLVDTLIESKQGAPALTLEEPKKSL